MKKIVLCALLCTLLNAGMGFATPKWVQIDNKMYIDTNSLRKENYMGLYLGYYYSIWVKKLNDKSKAFLKVENYYKTKIWYALEQLYFDCDNKSFAVKSYIFYNLEGESIDSLTLNDIQLKFYSIAPGTKAETWYNYACIGRY